MDIYGTGGPSLQRRLSNPPRGVKSTRQKKSEYAKQLTEKQKVKYTYGLREAQYPDKPSYPVAPGETIALTATAVGIPEMQDELKAQRPRLSWLLREGNRGRVIGTPGREEIGMEIDEALIVEFYSR